MQFTPSAPICRPARVRESQLAYDSVDIPGRLRHLRALMDVTLAVLCDDAHERPDGKIDLLGVFNELRAPGFPAVQERMTVVFTLAWSPEEAGRRPLRADLVDEDGEMLLTIQGHTEVPAAGAHASPPVTRLIMPLERVVFPRAGHYHFRIVAGGHPHRACSIYVGELAA